MGRFDESKFEDNLDDRIRIQLSKKLEEKLKTTIDLEQLEKRSLGMVRTNKISSVDEILGISVDDLREFTTAMDALMYIAMREPTKTSATKLIIDFMSNKEKREITLKEFLVVYYLYTTLSILLAGIVESYSKTPSGIEGIARMFGRDRVEVV